MSYEFPSQDHIEQRILAGQREAADAIERQYNRDEGLAVIWEGQPERTGEHIGLVTGADGSEVGIVVRTHPSDEVCRATSFAALTNEIHARDSIEIHAAFAGQPRFHDLDWRAPKHSTAGQHTLGSA